MPEILLPSSTSILSSSSTASSLLLYNHTLTGPQHSLTRRKSLPLRRISGWQWLFRRISRQGLTINATHDGVYNHSHTHSPNHYDYHTHAHNSCDYDYDGNEKMISSPQRRKILAFETNHDYDYEKAQEQERDLAESYAAYCRAFTSAGLHQHQHQHGHKRKTWMMDGLIDHSFLEDSVHVNAEKDQNDECVDEKRPRETSEPELHQEPGKVLPPPQILTPSLYAEMRRAACDKKRARLRQRRSWSWSWSWFPHIRHRES